MEDFELLYNELHEELIRISVDDENPLIKAEKAIHLCTEYISHIKDSIVSTTFLSQKEEVTFFKIVKPRFISLLIYYINVFEVESRLPTGIDFQRNYLTEQLEKINQFFRDHLEFCKYYRTGNESLDIFYFVRGNKTLYFNPSSYALLYDERFSTSHDHLVATILAYDMFTEYIKGKLEKLNPNSSNLNEQGPVLRWTDKKSDFVEFIYGLHTKGSINNGKIEIQELVTAFGKLLSIETSNAYKTYREIRGRKEPRIRYFPGVIESLNNKMDSDDEQMPL